jgi:hypothetical protein
MSKPKIVLVGHLGDRTFFCTERSLLDILGAVDRRRFDVSCVLPQGSSSEYLNAVERHTQNVTRLNYPWWTRQKPTRRSRRAI